MTDLDKRIKALCAAKGIVFKPWEWPRPWDVKDRELCPYNEGSAGALWWPKCLELRRKLKEELSQ